MPFVGEGNGHLASTAVRFRIRAEDRVALLVDNEVVIGRSPYCTLVLTQETISRVHASLRVVGSHVEICDHQSSNGTWVNGVPIQVPTLVGPRDDIRLGRVPIQIEVASMRMSRATGHMQRVSVSDALPECGDTKIHHFEPGL